MQHALDKVLEAAGLQRTGNLEQLGGGDIASVYRVPTSAGDVLAKHDDARRLHFERQGLEALRDAQHPLIIPEVLGEGESWLILEWLEPHPKTPTDALRLAQGLRALHARRYPEHGWVNDNACGLTPQSNTPHRRGFAFQAEERLFPLLRACCDKGLMPRALQTDLEAIGAALPSLLAPQEASLLHGDLWSGNVLYTARGPALIDPAVYRHYPEVDLAMLTLFAAPSEAFFAAYWDGDAPATWPLREALFQLYPLMNHLLLFGKSYLSALEKRSRRVLAYL